MAPSHDSKTSRTSTADPSPSAGNQSHPAPPWSQAWGNADHVGSAPDLQGVQAAEESPFPDIFTAFERQESGFASPLAPGSQLPPGTPGGVGCDACHDEPQPKTDYERGPVDGRKVGTWLGEFTNTDLHAGAAFFPRFADLDTATGYARSLAQAAVVLQEERAYRVFELEHDWLFHSFTRQTTSGCGGRANIEMEPGVFVFMTEDSWAIEASNCGADGTPGGIAHEALSDGPGAERFERMLDARGQGFEEHSGTESEKLASFEVAMRMLMLDILEEAERRALERPGQFDGDYSQIITIAEAIDDTEGQLETLELAHRRAVDAQDCNACHEVAGIDVQVRELMEQRATLRLKFPLLSRFEPMSDFLAKSDEEQATAVGREAGSVVRDIRQTRDHVENGSLELWTLPPLIQATLQAGGFDDPEFRQQILDRAAQAEWQELIGGLALAALSIGLGLAAGAATGGLGFALGAAAITVGVVDATWQTGEYFEDLALSNTAEDKSQSFISPEQMQGAEFWLAVAWVGAGIDLAAGVKVLGLLRAGSSIAKALRAVGHAGKEAELIGATLAKNVGTELRRLGSHLDSDPAWALAGSQGIGPYDRVIRNPQVPNDEVRALRPDGWASQEEGGASVLAMSSSDDWDRLSFPGAGEAERSSGWQRSLGEGPGETSVHAASKARAGMARRPRHHVFPDEHRKWFEDRGFVGEWDIDNFTVELDPGVHQAIHGGGDWRTGRALTEAKGSGAEMTPQMRSELDAWSGEWNTTVMRDLKVAQSHFGEPLSREDVFSIVVENMREFGLRPEFVPYRGQ